MHTAFERHMQHLGFAGTRRSNKLVIDVSACDLEVRGSLSFILNHERSLPRFEIARHIDLAIVYGHIHSPSIGIGSERVLYLVGRLLHAMRDGMSGLLGFLRRRLGNVLRRLERLPAAPETRPATIIMTKNVFIVLTVSIRSGTAAAFWAGESFELSLVKQDVWRSSF